MPRKSTKAAPQAEVSVEKAEKVEKVAKKPRAPRKKALTYDNVVGALMKKFSGKKVALNDSLTAQIRLFGEADGIFYLEIEDGVMNIMPFDYINADLNINVSCENCVQLVTGDLDFAKAVYEGSLVVYGDLGKMLALMNQLKG